MQLTLRSINTNEIMKKIVVIAGALFLVVLLATQVYLFTHQPTPIDELRMKAAVLPSLKLRGLDDTNFEIPNGRPVVLIYFNSTCDHCREEMNAIKKEIDLFDEANLIFFSSEEMPSIVEFASWSGLSGSNVRFGKVSPEEVASRFGVLSLPQIFIYNQQGALNEIFSGETAPAIIAGALR